MSDSVVRKWGKILAIRIPMEVSRAAGLTEGEKVEVATQAGDIVGHRQEARIRSRQDAEAAAEEIIAESRRHSLGGVSIRGLVEDRP